jgi:hypothetical protein
MGITGYGGGGGRGSFGGEEQAASAPTMEYYGPDHSKAPDVATAASKLAELYQGAPQTDMSDPNELLKKVNDEAGNVSGMQSLINQGSAKGKNMGGMVAEEGMQPVTGAVNNEAAKWGREVDTWLNTGSTVPPSTWPAHVRSAAAAERKARDDAANTQKGADKIAGERNQYLDNLYSSKEFKGAGENQGEMESKFKEYVDWAIKTKRRPNLASFFEMNSIKYE